MGEYARRRSDDVRVKIGTCEAMYYLRLEDIDKVRKAEEGDTDIARHKERCFFRLPFPDEDNVKPGDYEDYNRGYRLYKNVMGGHEDFTVEGAEPGNMQLRHELSGLLLNVPCHHGMKLPEVVPPMRAFWNGKGWAFDLLHVKVVAGGAVRPVVGCRFCGRMWSFDWEDVEDYLHGDMKERLLKYKEKK